MKIINVVAPKNVSKSMTENYFKNPRIFDNYCGDREDPKQSLSINDLHED